MTLPSIYQIRESLADVDGALVGEPSTSKVDVGVVPCVPISLPRDNAEEMKSGPAFDGIGGSIG
jgi:hypothetical protein